MTRCTAFVAMLVCYLHRILRRNKVVNLVALHDVQFVAVLIQAVTDIRDSYELRDREPRAHVVVVARLVDAAHVYVLDLRDASNIVYKVHLVDRL